MKDYIKSYEKLVALNKELYNKAEEAYNQMTSNMDTSYYPYYKSHYENVMDSYSRVHNKLETINKILRSIS